MEYPVLRGLMCVCVCTAAFMHLQREREREREQGEGRRESFYSCIKRDRYL